MHVIATTAGLVGIAEMNRPPNNFFDKSLIRSLAEAFEGFEAQGMRAILLCSRGKNFCAGADFSNPASETVGSVHDGMDDHLYTYAAQLFRCRLPIVAAVQGAAVGGGLGVAMVADFRVASPESRFAANFTRLGFHPGFGLSVSLPRVIGGQQAAKLFYTGRRITGDEAHRINLADVLVPAVDLRNAAIELAQEIAASAPIAVQSVRATLRGSLAADIVAATRHELAQQEIQFQTEDFAEGIEAMAARRLPQFVGR
ncbi:enoyl-CoA hydratase/isomerase family protein [Rhizobium sp. BR 315]|uniref:enoyl-CoA hydratase/isomerase family protein n=1 Tax=Rhizobiaceae TaxID=82115 RepID=UPI003D34421D